MTNSELRSIQGLGKNGCMLLSGQKYSIDNFQRKFKWAIKPDSELIVDLITRFMEDYEYDNNRPREIVFCYSYFFLGSIAISNKNAEFVWRPERLKEILL